MCKNRPAKAKRADNTPDPTATGRAANRFARNATRPYMAENQIRLERANYSELFTRSANVAIRAKARPRKA